MKSITILLFLMAIVTLAFLPAVGLAQDGEPLGPDCEGAECGIGDLVSLVQRIINWVITISAPVAMIMFAWAGVILVTSGGSESKRKKAQTIFTNVAIGFAIILSAWLIVYTITTTLISDEFRSEIPVNLKNE